MARYELVEDSPATGGRYELVADSSAGQAKPTKREIYEDAMKRGWGTGVPAFVHELGGKVTDLTGSPAAGAVAHFLANAIPAFATSGRTAPATSATEAPAKWLMKTAVKPSAAANSPKEIDDALSTMLKENIYPTPGGMEKAGKIVGDLNKQVDAAVAQSPATVKVSDVTARLDDPMKRFGMQVNPQADTAAIEEVWSKFLTNPHIAGKTEIPVQLAHEMKKGTYRALGSKYGEEGAAAVEAQKALARGEREEVGAAVPNILEALKREAGLMNVRDVAMQRSMTQGNNNPFGLAALRMDHLPSAALTMADRMAAIRAFLAMQAYGAGNPQVLAPLGVTSAMQKEPGILYR